MCINTIEFLLRIRPNLFCPFCLYYTGFCCSVQTLVVVVKIVCGRLILV
jgi:hypothetical protein